MGYASVDKLQAKITHTVECQYLGLDKSTFDFLYTQPEFIRKLILVLDINSLFFNAIINEIQVELTRKKKSSYLIHLLKLTLSVQHNLYVP